LIQVYLFSSSEASSANLALSSSQISFGIFLAILTAG
jgi:hypothetical protein